MDTPLNRIAYVEDDADVRAIAEFALDEVGTFTLASYTCGAAALEGIPGFKPDLILLDMMMPGMDGAETLRRLRTIPEYEHTPVVFMTAKAQSHELEKYRSLGAVDVIVKPFDPMTLADTLRALWDTL